MTFTHILVTAVTAIAFTSILGIWLIPFLRKLKYGQTILEIGPSWHKNKQGTPTMGGIMFVFGILVASIAGMATYILGNNGELSESSLKITKLVVSLVMAIAFGLVGFIDDYIKVVKKQNLGLTARQKSLFQITVAVVYLAALYALGDTSTTFIIPFIGQFDFGILYYPVCVFIIVGCVNAVNLTDGIDGLASSVTFVSAISLFVMSALLYNEGMKILSIALAGGCLGFLIWNFHPAKVFMGDTGSLFLGGIVVAIAFGLGLPFILIFVGIIYIIETLSVILQVISFKTTGKRIFKMSPIHHHFEMSG
ncbi:MAG: phospho-N-acetylmuramoyl-pentapeptide-transferase, partial [Oscillospiraceae bacterium]